MILCLGTTPTVQRTLVFERLTLDAVNRAAQVTETSSGKSINVARVARTLGEDVMATGFLGGDSGQFIRDNLFAADISHDFVTVEPKTRTCVTVIDRAAGTATELIEESKEVENDAWDALHSRLDDLLPRAAVLVLSGSLPPNAPLDFYARCVKRALDAAVPAILDAIGEPLHRALSARPMVVKPNRVELGKTLGILVETDGQLRDAIRRLLDQGPAWAVITLGAEGSVVSDGKSFWRIKSPAVKVVSTIGAGDSFAAGLAVGIAQKQPMPGACQLAAACAAANCMTSVAGFVRMEDVNALVDQVRLEPW